MNKVNHEASASNRFDGKSKMAGFSFLGTKIKSLSVIVICATVVFGSCTKPSTTTPVTKPASPVLKDVVFEATTQNRQYVVISSIKFTQDTSGSIKDSSYNLSSTWTKTVKLKSGQNISLLAAANGSSFVTLKITCNGAILGTEDADWSHYPVSPSPLEVTVP